MLGDLDGAIGQRRREFDALVHFPPIQRVRVSIHVVLGRGEAPLLAMVGVGGRFSVNGILVVDFLGGSRQLPDH